MKPVGNTFVYIFLIFTFSVGVTFSCDTPATITPPYNNYFIKYYGEDGNQQAVDMVINADGTFVILGTSSVGQGMILIKADAQGNTLWKKKFGSATDTPRDLEATLDNHYIILSNFQTSVNNTDVKLIRVNADGNKIDSAMHSTLVNEYGNSVTSLTDGGFIIAGSSEYKPANVPDRKFSFFHVRCDASLIFYEEKDAVWSDTDGYGNNTNGTINGLTKIFQNPDNSFYLFGYTNALFGNNKNGKLTLYYYSIDAQPLLSSVNSIDNQNTDTESVFVAKIPPALVEGYLIVSTLNVGSSFPNLRLTKLKTPLHSTNTEDIQFDKKIDSAHKLEGVCAAPSFNGTQGYLVVANETDEKGTISILLSKVDQNGDVLWSSSYGASKNDTAAAVAELPDGKIIILCTIQLDIQTKIALLKLNSSGQFLK